MKRLFRSMSARSASDNGSVASVPPSYQTVEASDTADLQTSASASDSRLVTRRFSTGTMAPPKPLPKLPPVALAYTPEETSETAADSDPGPMGYCYYRVYTPDGAIPSTTAFNLRNPYLGRIAVRSVPPPQKAASLQRRLVTVENLPMLDDKSEQILFKFDGYSNAVGLGVEEPILLHAQTPGIARYGTTPETAFALLLRGVNLEKVANTRIPPATVSIEDPVYLYYRLFTRIGEDTSNARFNLNDPALGRIEKTLLAPPHNAGSIKRQIARLEGKWIYAYAELYASISAPQPIENSTYLSLMQEQDDSPGLKEDNPMVLVQPERRPRVYNRPVEAILAYTADEGFQLAVGSRGASDGVLVQKAFFCKLDKRWNCACGRGARRSVTKVYWCEFELDQSGRHYGTYLTARHIKFLDE